MRVDSAGERERGRERAEEGVSELVSDDDEGHWKREYSSHFMNERRRDHSYLSIDTHPEVGAMRYSSDLLRTGL